MFVARRSGRRVSGWVVKEAALFVINDVLTPTPEQAARLGGWCVCEPHAALARSRGSTEQKGVRPGTDDSHAAPRPLLSPSLSPLVSLPPFHPV